jgi:ABC-2 type transport system permease protein
LRKLLLIAKRDYLASIRTKAFLIGLFVAPLLFGGSMIAMAFWKDKEDVKERRVAILDHTGVAAAAVIEAGEEKNARSVPDPFSGRPSGLRFAFEAVQPEGDPGTQRLALSDRVRGGELFAFLEIGPAALEPGADREASRVGYYSNAGGIDEARRWLAEPVNDGLRRLRLARLGVDRKHFETLLRPVLVERLTLVERDAKTGDLRESRRKSEIEGFAAPFAMVMLLGMIVLTGATPMLSAVTEDKTQRVVEMLLGAATPFQLMGGKVLAAVGVSLTSSAFYVVGATLALNAMGMIGMVPFHLLPWFYVYLVADVVMLCAIAAALGSACSTAQEAQNLGVLLVSPVIIPFFVIMPILRQPDGFLATAMSLFPPFTPLLMLLRQSMPAGVPGWQPWVGLVGILAFTVLTVWAAARIFRIGILMQGKAPKASELIRWAIRG